MPEVADPPSTAPHPSQPDTLVLHGLRLKPFPETDVLARRVELDEDVVAGALGHFSAEGFVRRLEGHVTGWTLTPDGRREGERRLAEELDAAGARTAVESAYEAFAGLNDELLAVCTAWQLRDDAINDHRDQTYDQAVILRLVALHDKVRPVVAGLRASLARFGGYAPRLRSAIERVTEGEVDWFTKPTIDSYHTVWFELHEDLLATLGLERSRET